MINNGKVDNSIFKLMRRISFAIIYFVCISVLQAGTTGKIKGKVIDAETGDALPGVNVIIAESSMGSATDIDGFFIILKDRKSVV